MCVSNAGANHNEAPFRCYTHPSGATLHAKFLALPTNIRLGWTGLPETQTLA